MNGFDSPRRAAAAAALQAATVNIAQAISVHEFPGVQVAKEIKVEIEEETTSLRDTFPQIALDIGILTVLH